MDRRTLLTVSTAACLCGMYECYAMFVSPIFAPRADIARDQAKRDHDVVPERQPENRRQAEQFLDDQPWTYLAKYQFQTDAGFFYFQEWEKVEETGKVRFKPFAMIWRPQGHDPAKDPYTIVSDSALVEFAEKFELKLINPHPGRVVGGSLEGNVRIRGPDALSIQGKNFNFAEGALRVWSDQAVSFSHGSHTGRGQGLELALIPATGPLGDDKPAVTGVRTVRLLKDVGMELVSESKSTDKPDETVFIDSQGSFEYEVEAHVATFQKNVQVKRPTGGGKSDRLNCEQLTLIFEPEAAAPAGDAGAPPVESPPAKVESTGALGGRLAFRRLRAEGPSVTVVSQRSDVQGWMSELTYDMQARVIALRDGKQVRLLQKNNELLCPEITAVLDEDGQIEQAICRGAGKLFSYAKAAEPKPPRGKKLVELAAEWQRQLHKRPDALTGLDLIEFEGRAVLNQTGKMALKGEIVRIWVTPGERGSGGLGRGDPPQSAEEQKIEPKKMLAIKDVAFASPQISGQTERLEVWFEEGSLPTPPLAQETTALRHGAMRPATTGGNPAGPVSAGRAVGQGSGPSLSEWAERAGPARDRRTLRSQQPPREGQTLAAIADAPPRKASRASLRRDEPSGAKDKAAAPDPKTPLSVTADLIRVRSLREGDKTELAEVITEGHVHVTQDHAPGESPLDLRGERLHLWNYSESNQVVHVEGRPAHVRDRGMQIEGPDIHFDRGQNLARVDGAGLLRLPMSKDFQGKPLDAPQLLDVFWQEKMEFDGEVAKFYERVRTQLNGSEMRCEEMHVTFANRVSFSEKAPQSQPTDVKFVVCRDGVDMKSHEYEDNRLVEVRIAKGFEFTIDRSTGRITSQGPGTLMFWRRGNGKRAGLEPSSGVRANRPLATESVEWEYTRIDFAGKMQGNSNDRFTRFRDRVRVLYGPVEHSTDTFDEDSLPKDGGWMRCHELELTQHPEKKPQKDYITMKATGNVELDGRSFHAMAHIVTYDESKGLYVLNGDGKQDAKIWREKKIGAGRDATDAQRMEFNPAMNVIKIDRASGGQGSR